MTGAAAEVGVGDGSLTVVGKGDAGKEDVEKEDAGVGDGSLTVEGKGEDGDGEAGAGDDPGKFSEAKSSWKVPAGITALAAVGVGEGNAEVGLGVRIVGLCV